MEMTLMLIMSLEFMAGFMVGYWIDRKL